MSAMIAGPAGAGVNRAGKHLLRWRNWQTRKIQVLVPERVCRFDPDPEHLATTAPPVRTPLRFVLRSGGVGPSGD